MLDWEDFRVITHEEARAELLETLEGAGFQGTSWQEGDPALFGVELGAALMARLSAYAVFLRDNALNDTAKREGLTRLSRSRFGNERNPALATQRKLTLTCAAGEGPHTIGLGDLVATDADGHTFRNIEGLDIVYPITLASGGTVTLLFEAEIAGAAHNVANGNVNALVTTLAGVTISADVLYRAGQDEESDERLRARNASKVATRALEPIRDTIENLALEAAPAVTAVGIDDGNPRGAGTFDVYLAGDLATATQEDVDAVQAALDARVFGDTSGDPNTRPGYAVAATPLALDITATVYYSPAFEAAAVQAGVEAALLAFVRSIPLGGFDYSSALEDVVPVTEIAAAIKNATVNGQQGAVRAVVIATPSADVEPDPFEKVIPGTWTLTFTPTDS